MYPGNRNIIENNISSAVNYTGGGQSFGEVNGADTSVGNKFYGNITIGGMMWVNSRGDTLQFMPRDTLVVDYVNINATEYGFNDESSKNTRCDNCSFIGGSSIGMYIRVNPPGFEGDGASTFFSDNTLIYNTSTGSLIQNQSDWKIDFANYFGKRHGV